MLAAAVAAVVIGVAGLAGGVATAKVRVMTCGSHYTPVAPPAADSLAADSLYDGAPPSCGLKVPEPVVPSFDVRFAAAPPGSPAALFLNSIAFNQDMLARDAADGFMALQFQTTALGSRRLIDGVDGSLFDCSAPRCWSGRRLFPDFDDETP